MSSRYSIQLIEGAIKPLVGRSLNFRGSPDSRRVIVLRCHFPLRIEESVVIRSKFIAVAFSLALAASTVPALAAWRCSIHPPKTSSDAQLRSMARVSESKAERIALERVAHGAKISSAELESEQGCLIWSFDLKVPGRKGIQEVNIDAGNGKILGMHREGAGASSSQG